MRRSRRVMIAFAIFFLVLLAFGYFAHVPAPEGWFGERSQQRMENR